MTEAQKISLQYARQHEAYEKTMYPIFLRALRKQIKPVIAWVEELGVNPPLDALVDKTVFRKPMVTAYGLVSPLAAKREYYYMKRMDGKGFIDILIDKWRQIFIEYALNYAYRIENELAETTKNEIREALQYAYENNLNATQTASYIRKRVYNQISRHRAVVIARTEATTASNIGKETGAREWLKEQGQTGYKQWIGREDERERHTHNELNDRIIPIDEAWSVGGFPAKAPGDVRLPGNERIMCRCTTIYMSERRYLRMRLEQ